MAALVSKHTRSDRSQSPFVHSFSFGCCVVQKLYCHESSVLDKVTLSTKQSKCHMCADTVYVLVLLPADQGDSCFEWCGFGSGYQPF